MSKRKAPDREPIDIFGEDGDLSRAASALEDATSGPERLRPVQDRPAREHARSSHGSSQSSGRAREHAEHAYSGDAIDRSDAVDPICAALKFRVRRGTRDRLDSFRVELGIALGGVRLTDSHVGRALLTWLLEEGREAIVAEAEALSGSLRRPPADDPAGLAAFDAALRDLLLQGIRRWATRDQLQR